MPYGLVGDGTESVDWRMSAACLDQDPELFFPVGTTASAAMQATVAKQVCAQCQIRETCLDWATPLALHVRRMSADTAWV